MAGSPIRGLGGPFLDGMQQVTFTRGLRSLREEKRSRIDEKPLFPLFCPFSLVCLIRIEGRDRKEWLGNSIKGSSIHFQMVCSNALLRSSPRRLRRKIGPYR